MYKSKMADYLLKVFWPGIVDMAEDQLSVATKAITLQGSDLNEICLVNLYALDSYIVLVAHQHAGMIVCRTSGTDLHAILILIWKGRILTSARCILTMVNACPVVARISMVNLHFCPRITFN